MKNNIVVDVFAKCAQYMNRNLISDQFYGTITCQPNGIFTKVVCNRNSNSSNNDVIIVVLESPHIDEFLPNKMHPLANDTLFKDHLHDCLNYYISNHKNAFLPGIYDIYLMNSIQYQCSLGFDTDYYRDIVFLTLWEFLEPDFVKRLNNSPTNGKTIAILNLVTKGSHKFIKSNCMATCANITGISMSNRFLNQIGSKYANRNYRTLNDIVNCTIHNVIGNRSILLLKGTHPSSWRYKKNRYLI